LYFNYKKDFLFQQVVEKGLSARRKKRSNPPRTPVRQDLIFWQQRRNQAVKLYFNYKKDFLFQQVVEKGLSARRKKRSSPPRTPVR
jgi:hypothetical protein